MFTEKIPSRFSVEVASRISRASYGIVCLEAWDEEKHREEDKFYDTQWRAEKAKKQIKWLIKEVRIFPDFPTHFQWNPALVCYIQHTDYPEGDDVMANKKIRHDFNKLIEVDQVPDDVSTSLWMCFSSPPPTRRDESVTKHSEMTWTAKVHWDRLPRSVNNQNEEFHELEFQTEMGCPGGATELSVLHKGARVAKSNIKVEYRDRANIGA